MKRLTSLASIASITLSAACGGPASDQTPETQAQEAAGATLTSDPAVAQTSRANSTAAGVRDAAGDTDANLKALRDLRVFEVRDVIVNIPEHANCYNLPCPGHENEFVSYEEAKASAGEALQRFTRTAIAAAADSTLDERIAESGHCYDTDEQNLKALQALRVVALGDLVLEAPGQNPNCYYAPAGQKLARIAAAFRKP